MHDARLLPDDPKLTAYALGELAGDERAAVEAALRQNPALRVAVEEIRAAAAQLEAALAAEAAAAPIVADAAADGQIFDLSGRVGHAGKAMPPAGSRRVAIVPGDDPHQHDGGEYPFPDSRPRFLRFPQFYYVTAVAAAACFAMLVALREPPTPTLPRNVEQSVRREIALSPAEVKPDDAPSVATLPVEAGETRIATHGSSESAPPAGLMGEDLSLIAQVQRERDRLLTMQEDDAGTVPEGTATVAENPEATGASEGVVPAEKPRSRVMIVFNAVPPPVSGAQLTLLPFGPSRAGMRPLSPSAPVMTGAGASEILMLPAFMVAADRANGFAGMASVQRVAPGKRGPVEREDLPPPPPGAKFSRNAESHALVRDNDFVRAADHPLSTFAVDVDTASYAHVRRIIAQGTPPPRDAVRIEELINYFPYHYPAPKGETPLAASIEVAAAPWAPTHKLVRIGLKAREVAPAPRPAASLIFLLDVSGSMNQPNKLPMVKQSLRFLIGRLRPDDRVAIVTYAGNSGLALASTPVARSREILNALDALTPGGATNGALGIQLAYDIAKANFVPDGINRVILCTDGDFNVGPTSEGELVRIVEEKASSGVFLTVLGFGMGNYRDAVLEKLAGKGHGSYGYIDTRREAERILVEQVGSTFVPVAKGLKIQVDFNPNRVSSYRLIGYENRLLRKEDFNNDKVDPGEIGAGHAITALYEIVPVGVTDKATQAIPPVDVSKYATPGAASSRATQAVGDLVATSSELLTVKVRYRKPDSFIGWPRTLEFPLIDAATSFAQASADFRFAAAVAQFGMILRGSPHRGAATMEDVTAWAAAAAATPADDPGGYRGEFIELVRRAQTLLE